MLPLCHTCHIVRPLRSKHCSVQKRCVSCFDHFCPYVNNTMGSRNYKYFILFMAFGLVGVSMLTRTRTRTLALALALALTLTLTLTLTLPAQQGRAVDQAQRPAQPVGLVGRHHADPGPLHRRARARRAFRPHRWRGHPRWGCEHRWRGELVSSVAYMKT